MLTGAFKYELLIEPVNSVLLQHPVTAILVSVLRECHYKEVDWPAILVLPCRRTSWVCKAFSPAHPVFRDTGLVFPMCY